MSCLKLAAVVLIASLFSCKPRSESEAGQNALAGEKEKVANETESAKDLLGSFTDSEVKGIRSEIQAVEQSIVAFSQMRAAASEVENAKAKILGHLVEIRSKIRQPLNCEAFVDAKAGPPENEATELIKKLNLVLSKNEMVAAVTTGTVYNSNARLFDEFEIYRRGVFYPGMSVGIFSTVQDGVLVFSKGSRTGIAAVYDPASCNILIRTGFRKGMAGVYNPITRAIEWREAFRRGVTGSFNPKTGKIEWFDRFLGGAASLFDPVAGVVKSQVMSGRGMAMVWNPLTSQIESKDSYNRGIAGYFDPMSKKVKFVVGHRTGGSVIVSLYPGLVTLQSQSTGCYGSDD